MMTTMMPGVPVVRAVERAAGILGAFTPATRQLTLGEVSRRAGLDKSTTRRLLGTLQGLGWVDLHPRTRTYSLGIGLLAFIPVIGLGRDIGDIAAPIMTRLSQETDATSFLWVNFHNQAMCIERVRAENTVANGPWSMIGTRVPLHVASGPRILLAHMPAVERAAVLSRPLISHTPMTQCDPLQIEASCHVIHERGWELAIDDHIVGLAGLGVPIIDRRGSFVASLSISALTRQLPLTSDGPRHLAIMKQAANEIGARIVHE